MDGDRAVIVAKASKAAPERALLFQQADWHMHGLIYHLRRMRELYEPATESVAGMAAGDPAGNILITTAPEMQQLLFEFYAFMSLARVTADQLLHFAGPCLNIHKDQRPSSINEAINWETDFPVFVDLAGPQRPVLRYLIDIRDCIVHGRTFATSDGVVAVEEGFPEDKVPDMTPAWYRGVVRTYFRRLGGTSVSVNISLPDVIWQYSDKGERGKMLDTFTYGQVNLLSQSHSFAQMCLLAVLSTLGYVVSGEMYELRKPRSKQATK